jgi:hypothetical protein
MRAMYWQGQGSAVALAYGDVSIGMRFQQGPQWPYNTNPAFFTAGVVYTVTGVTHQPDLPVMGPPFKNDAPVPWDTTSAFPNTSESNGWVTFDQPMAGSFGAAGYWIPTVYLANAQRIS